VAIDRTGRLRTLKNASRLKSAKSRRVMSILAMIVIVPVYALFVFKTTVPVWWYATGTSTKALIAGCGTENRGGKGPTVCRGSWTMPDGTRRSGKIVGPGKRDVGTTMTVRASRDHAAEPGFRLFGSPLLLAFPAFLFLIHSRGRRRAAASARSQ
jgi:hypothetical protein